MVLQSGDIPVREGRSEVPSEEATQNQNILPHAWQTLYLPFTMATSGGKGIRAAVDTQQHFQQQDKCSGSRKDCISWHLMPALLRHCLPLLPTTPRNNMGCVLADTNHAQCCEAAILRLPQRPVICRWRPYIQFAVSPRPPCLEAKRH